MKPDRDLRGWTPPECGNDLITCDWRFIEHVPQITRNQDLTRYYCKGCGRTANHRTKRPKGA